MKAWLIAACSMIMLAFSNFARGLPMKSLDFVRFGEARQSETLAGTIVTFGRFLLDNTSCFRVQRIILLIESRGTLLETIPEAEQERCPGWGS